MEDQTQNSEVTSNKDQNEMESDGCSTVQTLDNDEQKQFAEWLSKQDPTRQKHYMKLAQAYGFTGGDE